MTYQKAKKIIEEAVARYGDNYVVVNYYDIYKLKLARLKEDDAYINGKSPYHRNFFKEEFYCGKITLGDILAFLQKYYWTWRNLTIIGDVYLMDFIRHIAKGKAPRLDDYPVVLQKSKTKYEEFCKPIKRKSKQHIHN